MICLTLSSDLSNTLQSAQTASVGWPTRSQSTSLTAGPYRAAWEPSFWRLPGPFAVPADVAAVLRQIRSLIPRTSVFAALNTLENLKMGGRIGGAKAMLGSMLSIKPVSTSAVVSSWRPENLEPGKRPCTCSMNG